jgi:hypothetical protein
MIKKKKDRIISQLRKLYPYGEWGYIPGWYTWFDKNSTKSVVRVAIHSPRYDGDDDNYETRYKLIEFCEKDKILTIH